MKFLLLSTLFLTLSAQAQTGTMGSSVPSAATGTVSTPQGSGAGSMTGGSTMNSETYRSPGATGSDTTLNGTQSGTSLNGSTTLNSEPRPNTGSNSAANTFDGTGSSIPTATDSNANLEASGVSNNDLNTSPNPAPSANTSDSFETSTVRGNQDIDVYDYEGDPSLESEADEIQAEEDFEVDDDNNNTIDR